MRALIAVVVILFSGSELFVAAQRVGFAQRSGTTRQTGQDPLIVGGSAPPASGSDSTVRDALRKRRQALQKVYGRAGQGAADGSAAASAAGSSRDEIRTGTSAGNGAKRSGNGNGGVKLAFTDMPIDQVVNAVMTELGHSYVIDPAVSGTVSLFTMDDIPKKTLFRVLEQVLKLAGQAIVKQEGLYVVLPIGKSPACRTRYWPGRLPRARAGLPVRSRRNRTSGRRSPRPGLPGGNPPNPVPRPAP